MVSSCSLPNVQKICNHNDSVADSKRTGNSRLDSSLCQRTGNTIDRQSFCFLEVTNGIPVLVDPGQTVFFKTGLAMEIPDGYYGAIYARSGLATKQGLRPANCVGVIDSDYRGEIMVALHNDSKYDSRFVKNGDRIAQLIVSPYLFVDFEESDDLDDTERGDGGFGHTGV